MEGAATCAVEFVEDVPQLDMIMAPVSGGGLISGIALGAKHLKPSIKIFAVGPTAKNMKEAMATGKYLDHWTPGKFIDSKCEALVAHPGKITFPIMVELLEKEAFDVTDEESAKALKLAWQQLKLTIELSTATVVAALLSDDFIEMLKRNENLTNIGLILCGGNFDASTTLA